MRLSWPQHLQASRTVELAGESERGMALALMIGIQLGSLPWRYGRELWQAQGAAFGLVVGLAIGRLSARRSGGGA